MINTVIFDLDGTLLNTLEDLKNSTNFALSEFGYPLRTLEEVREFVGNGVAKLIERAIPQGINNPNFEKCLEIFKVNYSKNMYNKTAPYDGILDMLRELKLAGCKIAVVSNKFDSAVKELCNKYFSGLVDAAVGQMNNIPQKPAPDGVLKAIRILNSKKENCVYIGDSDVDVMTAKNSQLPCIGVSWGFRSKDVLKNAGCHTIVDKPCDIIKKIKEL